MLVVNPIVGKNLHYILNNIDLRETTYLQEGKKTVKVNETLNVFATSDFIGPSNLLVPGT